MENHQKKGPLIPISPSQTPRSGEKSSKGSNESNGNPSSKNDKEKGVNIQVILRCRPLSEDEMRVNTPVVISCNENRREVAAVQNIANKQIDRTFTFDKVFGPSSQQKDLFKQAVSPIVTEVLEGYNCTIFAYGQTGTGKTYTMEGGAIKAKDGDFPSDAGVIPRSVRQIFDTLEAQNAEYSMKVTFLELYNEEITDLLAPEESKFSEDKSKKPIALMEDGKGGVFVRGLEEEIVTTAGEIYTILEKCSSKRRTAETLLNKQSSRSHSIFSITIHIKESTPEGEEMIKCGKLNLVDLAGSENISRSGARDGRAREAGEINKSLLTLGRVINALVEHSGHVPYRDSKLTRLLRDSLGGKTKTCIIATISPSIHCLEETLNTLDYAHRAKNIKNKPEVNQKMMKSALIKDLYSEIDRLKQELSAAREKNGVYLPKDRFVQDEALKKISPLKRKLDEKEHSFSDLDQRYRQAKSTIKEKEYLISYLLKSEKALVENAHQLRSELHNAAADVSGLFSKLERKDSIEDGNIALIKRFHSQLAEQLNLLHKTVSASVTQQDDNFKRIEKEMQSFVAVKIKATEGINVWIEKVTNVYSNCIRNMDVMADELMDESQSTIGKLNSQILSHSCALEDCLKSIALEGTQLLDELKSDLSKMEDKLANFTRQQHEGKVRAVEATRSISMIATSFFQVLDVHSSKMDNMLKESGKIQNEQLYELEKKFEECAADEERQLLIKVEELLKDSNARRKRMVQEVVDSLRKGAAEGTTALQKEVSSAQDSSLNMREKWCSYMEETEKHSNEDITAAETGRICLEDGLRNGTEANQLLCSNLSSAASAALQDADLASKKLLSSVDNSCNLDRRMAETIGTTLIIPSREELRQLESGHYHGSLEIKENSKNCLEKEYKVDESTCSTPKRRSMNIPSEEFIEQLRTPAFEELLKSLKQANVEGKQISGMNESHPFRDLRAPLTTVN
ncbi:125 kDa kinesin-related protein [Apostasia shenzhenica]|uniref:Kinesin-like protein n=1 Tax=Apostasia shenzhenica TaxID=1088818 RepID=A0A2I0B653_9ASPA|nr:125 kDa kinesin-related protein [Apostasia shenzhenica]